jgi:hypothetical protein
MAGEVKISDKAYHRTGLSTTTPFCDRATNPGLLNEMFQLYPQDNFAGLGTCVEVQYENIRFI